MIGSVLHRYWITKPKHPIRKWREQFPKQGIWPVGLAKLKRYYIENFSLYGKKFGNYPSLLKLSSKKYKKANWCKRLFNKKETTGILSDRNYRSFNYLVKNGYLTPIRFNKKVIYFSSEEIQRELLVRELLMSMSDNIKTRDARGRQKIREYERKRKKKWRARKKKERRLLALKKLREQADE